MSDVAILTQLSKEVWRDCREASSSCMGNCKIHRLINELLEMMT